MPQNYAATLVGLRHRLALSQQQLATRVGAADLFSRFIVGWAVSAVNDRHVTIKALEMALTRRCPDIGLLHHSDQGGTYASEQQFRRRFSARTQQSHQS